MNAYAQIAAGVPPPLPPPHNIEMEQSLLGSLLLNNDVFQIVAPIVQQADFFEEIHRRVFEVAVGLITAGKSATPVSIKTFLGDHDINGLTVLQYLSRLAAHASAPLQARDHAISIHDLAVRRHIIAVATELAGQAQDMPVGTKPSTMAGDAITTLFQIASVEGALSTRREAHAGAGEVIERARKLRNREIRDEGAPTGFPDLDRATGGYRPGALWITAARPGVGKTVFFASSAVKVARRGWGVKGFSLEVAEDQMHARLLSEMVYDSRAPVPFKDILLGHLDDDAFRRLGAAHEELTGMPLVIDVAARLTVPDLRIRIRSERERMAARGITLRVAFIDYLKQVQASDRYKGQRHYEVGEISAGLKQIAKDEQVCVVLLAQLNRGLENREDKRPGLADLRESGDLEADADVVAFIHRESMFIKKSAAYVRGDAEAQTAYAEHKDKAELILGKNRAGDTATIPLWCNVACSSMASMAWES